MENNTILKFDGLSKKFGNKTVVDHISLEIKEGEIFGLLGPNGAGKSTTLNMVCSLLKPTSGNIEIFGMKTSNDMEKIKKKIGYIPQELYYLNAVKAPDAWEFIKGVPHEKVRVGIIDTGAQLDHPDLENVINKDLSVRITCDAVKTAYNTPTADMPTSVKLSSSSVTTVKGDTFKISASVTTLGQNKGVYYHTEDNGIAKVSQDGTITGVSDGETKLIVSTENSITDECVVKVQSIGGKKLEAPKVDEVQTGVYAGARIQWSKIDDADYYQIYASTGDDDTFRYIGSTTSTSYAALMGLGGEEVPASNVTKYRIKAVSNSSAFADSDLSSEFAYVYIGQEPNLKTDQLLEQGKDTGLLIHWGAIVSSKLYRKSSLDGEEKLLAIFGENMTKNYYEDTDLINGVTYTYTLKLFTEYRGVEYSEITSTLVVDYIDDDPLDTNLGKCEITGAEFTNNSVRLTCVSPSQCFVQQCLCSDNNGKSWFDVLNSIGSGENTFYIDKLEFGKTYLLKYKGFENALFGLYRDRSEYSDTITLTMPTELESPVIEAHTTTTLSAN